MLRGSSYATGRVFLYFYRHLAHLPLIERAVMRFVTSFLDWFRSPILLDTSNEHDMNFSTISGDNQTSDPLNGNYALAAWGDLRFPSCRRYGQDYHLLNPRQRSARLILGFLFILLNIISTYIARYFYIYWLVTRVSQVRVLSSRQLRQHLNNQSGGSSVGRAAYFSWWWFVLFDIWRSSRIG